MTAFMTVGSSEYNLFRAGKANPFPGDIANRLFYQTNDLFNTANITTERNLDVDTPGTATAYVSMYVLAVGIDNNLSPVYSRPRHIGIFRLANLP
jgi:hypothetical protein